MCREWETLDHTPVNGMSLSIPLAQVSGTYAKEHPERLRARSFV